MQALQIYHAAFDGAFFALSPDVRNRIENKIDEMGADLAGFSHYQMTCSDRFRLRVGDYRVIYKFDKAKGVVHLLAVGHRREVNR